MSEYLYVIAVYDGDGKLVKKHPLNVPVPLARGQYEKLTDEQLLDHKNDLNAEVRRRLEAAGGC